MTTSETMEQKPLWLLIEEKILELDAQDVEAENLEATIQRMAADLDGTGYNVSRLGGNLLELRWAVSDMRSVGRPLLKDLNEALGALTLEDMTAAYTATTKLLDDLVATWPKIKRSHRRPDVIKMVEKARLDLMVAKAKTMSGDEGIRYLIAEKVKEKNIISALEITEEKLAQVKEMIKQELAERKRVQNLLEKVADKSDEEKVKFLIENNVSQELIFDMAQVGQDAIDAAQKAMEEELKEKQRLAEEEAARKKAEAEGPALEDIPGDKMLEYIESIREILEFSDQEKEIRVMCEQSSIPKALVDITVSEPEKLDELEKNAQG